MSWDMHFLWRQESSQNLEHETLVAHAIGILYAKVEGQSVSCPRKVEYGM